MCQSKECKSEGVLASKSAKKLSIQGLVDHDVRFLLLFFRMKTSSAEETKLLSFIEDTNGFSSLRSRGRRVHNEDRAIHAHGRERRH